MKVLWLCNVMLPEIALNLGVKPPTSGGWISGLYHGLSQHKEISLRVLFPYNIEISETLNSAEFISFIEAENCETYFKKVLIEYEPDVVHIFGTEFKHTFNMLSACRSVGVEKKTVINIQGLVSYCAKHCLGSIPHKVINSKSFYDYLRKTDLKSYKHGLEERGKKEEQALALATAVIGRTEWDYAGVKNINDSIRYYYGGEILRDGFYKNTWQLDNVERYSIFVNHSNSPLKALYIILQALPKVLKFFPEAHMYCTGTDLLKKKKKTPYKLTAYELYLIDLIVKNNLEDHITFVGSLTEEKMIERFLKSHVCVSASAIENSSNTVCEAMMLGVPTISSNVGGISSLLKENEEGFLYQFDAPYMLAHYILKLFMDDSIAMTISRNARKRAADTHDRKKIISEILNVYEKLSQE